MRTIPPNTVETTAPEVVTRRAPLRMQHAQCELNFLQLRRLLPGFRVGQLVSVELKLEDRRIDRLYFEVSERNPYTAHISVRQQRPVWGARGIAFEARAYLDARMAEVVACPGARWLLARYPYPNPRMLAADEKWQLNRLLGEWLTLCVVGSSSVDAAAFAADA